MNTITLGALLALAGIDITALLRGMEAKPEPTAKPPVDWTHELKMLELPDGAIEFRCHLCSFWRKFGTKSGAATGCVAHYRKAHRAAVRFL